VKDRTSKDPKLNCRNWECGVVIPIPGPSTASQMADAEGIGVFKGHVPVPMQVPGEHYGAKMPWFFMEQGV